MTTPEAVYSAIKELPQPLLDEVMDFVEFLHYKRQEKPAASASLLAFEGKLASSKTFQGDPVEIQKELRDDWR